MVLNPHKYSIKVDAEGSVVAPFTGAQTQIVNEWKDVGYAKVVTVNARIVTEGGGQIQKGNILTIRSIGVIGVDESFNLRRVYLKR